MSRDRQIVVLTRDCMAHTVPAGDLVMLSEGGVVEIYQRLGGSITVRTEMGALLRVAGEDRDALGLEPTPDEQDAEVADGPFSMDRVWEALDQVYDPEIPVSIVKLGLVYRCEEKEGPLDSRRIEIDLTMTAPGCGMGDILRADAARMVEALPGVDEVEVEMVFDPPWGIDKMSDEAKLQLGFF